MFTTPRRITLYWLLLLLPTLAVGAGALELLRREQARLDERARALAQSQRAAIEARARLIAENVEVLVNDVQAGLMETLRAAPASQPDPFFEQWEHSNPLVRATFRLSATDQIVRLGPPARQAEVRAWLPAWISAAAPWRERGAKVGEQFALREADERRRGDVSWNVSQVQNLRSALKDVASQNNFKAEAPPPTERSGWMPWRDGSRLHLIGWRQPAFGGVFGVVVELSAIEARFGELLPKDGEFAIAFALEANGATLPSKSYRTASFSPRTAPAEAVVNVPISAALLPGWQVIGYARASGKTNGAGGGFFLFGVLLVGTSVAAIVSGGSLLLWQARRSEEQAAQKTSFVANVSHEFKTPLTTIRLYSELLEQGRVRDESQGREYLRTIGRETQRLARLVNNALDFSRLEQGRKKYARETVDLTAELGRLLDTHAPRVAEAGLELKRALPSAPLDVTTDRDALEQIVLNVIDNACKYAAGGAEMIVALIARAGGGAEIRISDRGPGVPPEHRELIFEKFHRVDDALTAEKSGAGLGLSIARQLARGLGGELRCAARAGGGAEFILELP